MWCRFIHLLAHKADREADRVVAPVGDLADRVELHQANLGNHRRDQRRRAVGLEDWVARAPTVDLRGRRVATQIKSFRLEENVRVPPPTPRHWATHHRVTCLRFRRH